MYKVLRTISDTDTCVLHTHEEIDSEGLKFARGPPVVSDGAGVLTWVDVILWPDFKALHLGTV